MLAANFILKASARINLPSICARVLEHADLETRSDALATAAGYQKYAAVGAMLRLGGLGDKTNTLKNTYKTAGQIGNQPAFSGKNWGIVQRLADNDTPLWQMLEQYKIK
jgi:hypothetical protein